MRPKLIAFHLPQFHPIPENDAWWGKGFTEWTNVTRATPLFPGHHQPQLPADLGFYDLRLPEARAAQAELAREYGIHGFCYYHYWFNGKRLLERPVEEILASGEPDFPFCLCWANENWTRRWDGAEQQVLIGQNYNDDDDRAHIDYLITVFRDPRYIRIDGRPLVLIYRAHHLPNPRRTTEIWRTQARKAGLGELFICRVENFFNERDDPHALGFDASIDFQPDWKAIDDEVPSTVLDNDHFVVDYKFLVDQQLARPDVPHRRFSGITPAWDNSSRRKKAAFITADSTPTDYEYWLKELIRREQAKEEPQPFIFINAWNEWAEGNHLEPDQKFGRQYLEATRRALDDSDSPSTLRPPPLGDPLGCDRFAPQQVYRQWLGKRALNKQTAFWHEQRLANVEPPFIQVHLNANGCDDEALSQSLRSIAGQLYEHWHLIVVSERPAPAINSPRISWATLPADEAYQAIIQFTGQSDAQWHVILDGGDTLPPEALLLAAQQLLDAPSTQALITDGDILDANGAPSRPWLAPGFNPDWIRSQLHIGGLVVTKPEVLIEALTDCLEAGVSSHRLAAVLRAQERAPHQNQRHQPTISLHGSATAARPNLEARSRLLAGHLQRLGIPTNIVSGLTEDTCRVVYGYPGQPPEAAIIVTHLEESQALLQTVEGILARTQGISYRIMLPLAVSTPPALRECLEQLATLSLPQIQICLVDNSSSPLGEAHQLAQSADADILAFVKSGLAPLNDNWLDALVRHTMRPEVGAVGGRVVGPDGTFQSGPIKLGLYGTLGTPFQGISAEYTGSNGELQVEQDCSALSANCLVVRRTTYRDADGFHIARFPNDHAATDFCLRLQEKQLLNVWTPFATLVSRSNTPIPKAKLPDSSDTLLLEDWLARCPQDPYFNRQLSRHRRLPILERDVSLSWEPLPWKPLPRIYVHPADMDGCGEIRIATPTRALARANLAQIGGGTRLLGPWELSALDTDSLVIQRPYSDTTLAWLPAYRKFSKAFLVYEIDDLLTRIPPSNDTHALFPADMERRLREGMQLCDRLIVSTEPLAQAYRHYAADVAVVPNLLDGAVWSSLEVKRHTSPKPRVGWAGSNSHGGDLAMMEEVFRSLAGEVDWIFFGFCPDSLRRYAKELHPPVPVASYPQTLASLGLDIAIAPLVANAFNEAKSNLKLLEYGALGYPVICSNVLPYQGELPVKLVANTAQHWIKAIRALAADLEERQELGTRLRGAVHQNWMVDQHLDTWLRAWTR